MRVKSEQELEKLIQDLLKVSESTLESELIEHSAKYAWFAVLLAKARKAYEQEKFELEVLEAELGRRYREELKLSAKVTERAIEEAILRDPLWQGKKQRVLDGKKDMLVSYVSLLKEQMKTGILDDVSRGLKKMDE